jgi:hypothetical protein
MASLGELLGGIQPHRLRPQALTRPQQRAVRLERSLVEPGSGRPAACRLARNRRNPRATTPGRTNRRRRGQTRIPYLITTSFRTPPVVPLKDPQANAYSGLSDLVIEGYEECCEGVLSLCAEVLKEFLLYGHMGRKDTVDDGAACVGEVDEFPAAVVLV